MLYSELCGRAATVLHLREALKEEARDCGRPEGLVSILRALRACYGMTTKEARNKLATLCRHFHTTLQEHATEVQRLLLVAYEDSPERHRLNMALGMFSSSLGNAHLQKHLMAIGVETLEVALRRGICAISEVGNLN